MKKLIFALALATVILCAPLLSAQTAVIEGPTAVEVGDLIVLDSSKSDKLGKSNWDIDDCEIGPAKHVGTFVCGEKLITSIKQPGEYTFELIVSKGELGIDKAIHTIIVTEAKSPAHPPIEPPIDPVNPTEPELDTTDLQTAVSTNIADEATGAKLAAAYIKLLTEIDGLTFAESVLAAKQTRIEVFQNRPQERQNWETWLASVNREYAKLGVTNKDQFKQVIRAVADGLTQIKATPFYDDPPNPPISSGPILYSSPPISAPVYYPNG